MTAPGSGDLAVGRPKAGPHDPVLVTPDRVPGSIRRTMSLDITRPDGLMARVVADGRGQDVRTDAAGEAVVVGELSVLVEVDQRSGLVTSVEVVEGPDDAADVLVGANVRSGFGRRLAERLPGEQAARTLRYSVLEDLGGAFLVSGYALLRVGALPRSLQSEALVNAQADICIGWATGSPLLETMRADGVSPVPMGPPAPGIRGDDPSGWHAMDPMAVSTVRRRRRLDVAPDPEHAGGLRLHSHFRDSYCGADGETVMHEYVVTARLDGERRVTEVAVEPRVLPWEECPGAVASAQVIVGAGVDELPARARADLTGNHTCTHLSSTLRCLADAAALDAHLGGRPAA
jgi:hypothetical protein